MASNPSFQFYPSDFLVGTVHMTAEEVGGYIRLLCAQWEKGAVPDDTRSLRRMSGVSIKALRAIKEKFVKGGDGLLRNPRLERCRMELAEFAEKQRQRANRRWGKPDPAAMPPHMPPHDSGIPSGIDPASTPAYAGRVPDRCSSSSSSSSNCQSVSHAGASESEPPAEPHPIRRELCDLFGRWLNAPTSGNVNWSPLLTWLATVEGDPGGLELALRCVQHALTAPNSNPHSAAGAVKYVQKIYERCRQHDCEPGDFGADHGNRKTHENRSRIRADKGKFAGLEKVCGPGERGGKPDANGESAAG